MFKLLSVVFGWGLVSSTLFGQDQVLTTHNVPATVFVVRDRNPNVAKIQEALLQQTSVEFPGNPLTDVVMYISTLHNIPVVIDAVALLEQRVAPDQQVKLIASGISLKAALGRLLQNVGGVQLDFVIRDEMLTITTAVESAKNFETRLYDVRALQIKNPQELVQVLKAGTSGNWQANGGAIGFTRGVFVVRQTTRVHQEIEDLLNTLNGHFQEAHGEIPDWSEFTAGAPQ